MDNKTKAIKLTILLIILIILGVVVIFFWSKYQGKKTASQTTITSLPPMTSETTVARILENLANYKDKTIVLNAKFGGWGSEPKNCDTSKVAVKTKSDILIYDETGCLYESGAQYLAPTSQPDPDNKKNIGMDITIKGTLKLLDDKPYIGPVE
jgi:hypothetical protein